MSYVDIAWPFGVALIGVQLLLFADGDVMRRVHMLVEILAQGLANILVLALPGLIIATNSSASISPWEVIGVSIWAVAYILESVADGKVFMFISPQFCGHRQHPG